MVPEKLKDFVANFEGRNKGRYHIMYLTLINIVGGDEVRKKAQEAFGREKYLPEEMYPTREGNQMVMFAVENGVPAERLGRTLPQVYKRANPEAYAALDRSNAIDAIILAYDRETDYGKKAMEVLERSENRAVIKRMVNPMPCDFFKGAVLGHFELLGIPCEVNETACMWTGDSDACVYEITWK